MLEKVIIVKENINVRNKKVGETGWAKRGSKSVLHGPTCVHTLANGKSPELTKCATQWNDGEALSHSMRRCDECTHTGEHVKAWTIVVNVANVEIVKT